MTEKRVDVTGSVMLECAAAEYERATAESMRRLGLPVDMMEHALRMELDRLRGIRLRLFATALAGEGDRSGEGGGKGDEATGD